MFKNFFKRKKQPVSIGTETAAKTETFTSDEMLALVDSLNELWQFWIEANRDFFLTQLRGEKPGKTMVNNIKTAPNAKLFAYEVVSIVRNYEGGLDLVMNVSRQVHEGAVPLQTLEEVVKNIAKKTPE